jgi:phosphoglycerate kinase
MYDIGPKTMLAFARELKKAKTIVWNGPLGWFEHKPFDTGTMALARVVGGVGRGKAFATVGGGETVDALRLAVQADYIDHLSTGGGAMLAYLAGEKLPGIAALK